ncbi:MAG TPA: tripartite tricarboxylate transporter substrate binding protein [Burkholderiales bacterium]|nr:tripartite tricarboxylate transporter substrate binding protein [Burkholderiales bacterium]
MARASLLLLLAGISLACACVPAAAPAADSYPVKPLRIVVGFPSGGPADIAARILAGGLQDALKQNVIVDNRTGAGGSIAAQLVAKSPADGYTLLVATASLTLNPTLSPNVGYDAVKDFIPVGLLATQANALAVTATLPVKTLKELQALAKKHKMTYATAGVGTSSHLSATYLINVLWKTDAAPVPYRGAGPAGIAVASGETPIAFMTITGVLPLQQNGKVRILAVVSDKRLPALPNVPTMEELGYPQLNPSWTAVFAPADTPASVAQKIHEAVAQVMSTPDFKDRIAQQAMVPGGPATLKQLADYIRSEAQVWERIVRTTGAKAE